MKPIIFLIFILLSGLNTLLAQTDKDYYTAAVVEYYAYSNDSLSAKMIIDENVNQYITLIGKARDQKADIIVFPECGLTGIHMPSDQADLLPFTSIVPDPSKNINPCNEKNQENINVKPWADFVERISCAAKDNKMYVVVNLPERSQIEGSSDQFVIYNTNLVFDKTGTVIARYRKFNLFGEPGFNITNQPEYVTFKTDFGVTFGTFICFDILFAKPALVVAQFENVTDIVYPTAWFSELPFLTAVQTQAGWARANGVNLLAAGLSEPKIGNGGSGIYSPFQIETSYMPWAKRTTLHVANVSKIQKGVTQKNTRKEAGAPVIQSRTIATERLLTKKENFTNYQTKLISEIKEDNYELCHGKFCCYFTLKYDQTPSDYYYRAVAYKGLRSFEVRDDNIEICGLAACSSETVDSCGNWLETTTQQPIEFQTIEIRGKFSKDANSVIFPSTVNYFLETLPFNTYSYTVKEEHSHKEIVMKTDVSVKQLLGFGIYGVTRSFAITTSAFAVNHLILLTVSVFFVWYKFF